MAVDRLSLTVPSELGVALRKLAASRGETVSATVTEAIALRVRLAALDQALEAADRRFGPVPAALVARAEKQLVAASHGRRAPRRRRRPR